MESSVVGLRFILERTNGKGEHKYGTSNVTVFTVVRQTILEFGISFSLKTSAPQAKSILKLKAQSVKPRRS